MRIPYRRRPSPVPNATNGRKEKSIACSECHNCQKRGAQCKKRSPGCRREQENHSQKVCNTTPKLPRAPGIFAACYRLMPPTPRGWVEVAGCKGLPIQTPNDSHKGLSFIVGAEKRGSDPRPQPWQGCALPTELFPQYNPVPRGWDYKGTEFF